MSGFDAREAVDVDVTDLIASEGAREEHLFTQAEVDRISTRAREQGRRTMSRKLDALYLRVERLERLILRVLEPRELDT